MTSSAGVGAREEGTGDDATEGVTAEEAFEPRLDFPFFQNLIFLFNPNAQIESHTTVGRDIERLFKMAQEKLIKMFGVRIGISLSPFGLIDIFTEREGHGSYGCRCMDG